MPIPIFFEDKYLLVVDKPAGLLVHLVSLSVHVQSPVLVGNLIPGIGRKEPTLVDWLIEYIPDIHKLNWPDNSRPGIVHRLDRDTSGVMVIAKTPEVLLALQEQFQARTIDKHYLALVVGSPNWEEQTVRAPISRRGGTRRKASFLKLPNESSKDAETIFRVLTRFTFHDSPLTAIEAVPRTGRTNQIRVHLQLLGFPILGDPWYETKTSRLLAKQLTIPRLMLHAQKLSFTHPQTGNHVTFEALLPKDMEKLIHSLDS